ncbi:thioredoxin-related transmembrane protein 1-like [Pararge aegeria]|uniref:Jg6474 protein n=2 Tax=Pararge aegeria TaxID=116150 RepID=A0A8S4SK59_9NEOP|nr:thioredoxin-related transmembrane protein 1-like [Pararge aegeria]CAH2269999.1 jg6474 [Pararge aegeria aegeria]
MARLTKTSQVLNIFLYSCVFLCSFTKLASASVELDEDNWRQILDGEWMVEFYAPWCPACNALSPAWQELSNIAQKKNLGLRAGAVDVTKSPGLSGRFVVTALPTIYHVKDGVFRQYKGPRDADSMADYVERGRWKQTEAIPSWKSPDSLQMGLVAHFFKLSQALRGVHETLMETYGMPMWGSYLIFAVATICIGAILGLLLVCLIDVMYPPRKPEKVMISRAEAEKRRQLSGKKDDDDQELINDDIVDDAENSDAEKNSPSDTSEDDKEKSGAGDEAPSNDAPEVRKRRPRKAD